MVKITLLIDKEAKKIGSGIDLVKLAARLKTVVRNNPNIPDEVAGLLKQKAEQFHKKGSKMIL